MFENWFSIWRYTNNSQDNIVDFEFLECFYGENPSRSSLACDLFFRYLPPFSSSKKSTWRPWVLWNVFAQKPRCGGSEFALILAMLLRPCLGQAMVCMVVLSAAALASQTHYSYLNEFSLALHPLSPSPSSLSPPSSALSRFCYDNLCPLTIVALIAKEYFYNNVFLACCFYWLIDLLRPFVSHILLLIY